jgi:predicted transcriptional regulator
MKEQTDLKILKFLRMEDWPVTTEMVAKALRCSWNTAQVHLYKLLAERLIKGKRVGRQNQWMITDEGKRRVKE